VTLFQLSPVASAAWCHFLVVAFPVHFCTETAGSGRSLHAHPRLSLRTVASVVCCRCSDLMPAGHFPVVWLF